VSAVPGPAQQAPLDGTYRTRRLELQQLQPLDFVGLALAGGE
jgi:hypothetical protein